MLQNNQSFLTYLQAVPNTRNYLTHCYEKQGIIEAKTKAYRNSERFCYFLEHGRNFLATGKSSPLTVQPMLLFYGLGHLLKACLLVKDPDYPASSKVLAHGLTTRKRKKQNYSFTQDEVKIQPQGLFSYACEHLFNCSPFQSDKASMENLLQLLPDMQEIYQWSNKQPLCKVSNLGDTKIILPLNQLFDHQLTERKLKQRFSKFPVVSWKKEKHLLHIEMEQPFTPYFSQPFYYSSKQKAFYTSFARDTLDHLPEMMIHYILLYNLSMICRYEVEWWMDLHHIRDTSDYALLTHFIVLTSEESERMVQDWLLAQK
ncbi:YaaC family protein [Halobacillus sp. MO56]